MTRCASDSTLPDVKRDREDLSAGGDNDASTVGDTAVLIHGDAACSLQTRGVHELFHSTGGVLAQSVLAFIYPQLEPNDFITPLIHNSIDVTTFLELFVMWCADD